MVTRTTTTKLLLVLAKNSRTGTIFNLSYFGRREDPQKTATRFPIWGIEVDQLLTSSIGVDD